MIIKKCSKCQLEKPSLSFNKDGSKKHGLSSRCKDCAREATRDWSAKNPEKKKLADKDYYLANRESIKSRQGAWRQNNLERVRRLSNEWRLNNYEKVAASKAKWKNENPEKRAEAVKRWQKQNPDVHAFHASMRRDKIRKSALAKAYSSEIRKIYKDCRDKTNQTGVRHNVDHIFPLVGKQSNGLHVPWNLRIIPEIENKIKGNQEPSEERLTFSWMSKFYELS